MLTLSRPQSVPAEPEQSDIELVRRARHEPGAFEPIFARYWGPVLRFCYVRLNDWLLAEDAASQVFVNALAHVRDFRGDDDSAFRSWLFQIAHNSVRDVHRDAYRHPAVHLAEGDELMSRDRSPEESALERERQEQLQTLLSNLPDEQRQLLELRAVGLTAAEIGKVLGKSEIAVRQAQSRLIRSLRQQLGDAQPSRGA